MCVRVRVRVAEGATLLLNVRNVTERLPRITNQRRQSVTVYLPLTRRLHIASLVSLLSAIQLALPVRAPRAVSSAYLCALCLH